MKLKRFFAILYIVISIFTYLSLAVVPATAAPNISFFCQPTVYDSDDWYNIIWVTTKNIPSLGYVTYTYQGTQYTVYDEANGVIRTDDYIHSVRVPKEHLHMNSYRVHSRSVVNRSSYGAEFGTVISSATISFRGYTPGQEQINVVSLSDIHGTDYSGNFANATAAMNKLVTLSDTPKSNSLDLLVINGDVRSTFETADHFTDTLLTYTAGFTKGTIPVVYTRGNHETRGQYAAYIKRYMPTTTGEMYYASNYGPLSYIVIDSGEDKIDTHVEYSGLVDFESYRNAQYAWMQEMGQYPNPNATYKIAFSHIQSIHSHFGKNWRTLLGTLGTQLQVSGHSHNWSVSMPDDTATFPLIQDGGWQNSSKYNTNTPFYVACLVKLTNNQITVTTDRSNYTGGSGIPANLNHTINVPAPVSQLSYQTQLETNKYLLSTPLALSSQQFGLDVVDRMLSVLDANPNFYFKTKPVVFDIGDNYLVMWETNLKGTGQVVYEYEGVEYVKSDAGLGTLRTDETLHSVVVPKEHLDNNRYSILSHHITSHKGYSATKGMQITSGYIDFVGYHGQEEINIALVSDISGNSTISKAIENSITELPDILVLGGDNVVSLATQDSFTQTVLPFAANVTSGKRPVIFIRGESEMRGTFAANLSQYFKTVSGEFYFNTSYGPLNASVLDTGANEPDDSNEYGGLISCAPLRARQKAWLTSQSADIGEYNLVFADNPQLGNFFGDDWSGILNGLGKTLLISGNGGGLSFEPAENEGYATYINGDFYRDSTAYTKITLKDGDVAIAAINRNGEQVFSTDAAAPASFKGEAQPLAFNSIVDVGSNKWYINAVEFSVNSGLMFGVSETEFAPLKDATREMFVSVIANLSGINTGLYTNSRFSDVDMSAWYGGAVAWANDAGITDGYGAKFGVGDGVTKEQACRLVVNYLEYNTGCDLPYNSTTLIFADATAVSSWAEVSVKKAVDAGIIFGTKAGNLKPKTVITRAEMATIFSNI